MANHPVSPERLALAEKLLDEGWPFKEITLTYGIAYRTLCKYFPGRQWTIREAALHGVLCRDTKIKTVVTTVPVRVNARKQK